jgi:TetR/AcrR family transcriptional repressor of nem operon
MARPRKFDEETVLNNAMSIFWQKGYNATSTEDLENATKIRRGSLYNAYTDKRTLFFKVLEYYGKKEISAVVSMMTEAKVITTGYKNILEKAIEQGSENTISRGCLLCDTASELGGKDKSVAEKVSELFAPMAQVFFEHFLTSDLYKNDEEILSKVDAVMSGYMGFRLMCKLGYTKKRLKALAKQQVKLLGI